MSIIDYFKMKTKREQKQMVIENKREKKSGLKTVADTYDEEYQLPKLKKGSFVITDELLVRMENEKLLKQYQITVEKQGEFV